MLTDHVTAVACVQLFSNLKRKCQVKPYTTAAMAENGAQVASDPRVSKLRESMAKAEGGKGVQVYIVPTEDPHMSEYPPDAFKRREYMSK